MIENTEKESENKFQQHSPAELVKIEKEHIKQENINLCVTLLKSISDPVQLSPENMKAIARMLDST